MMCGRVYWGLERKSTTTHNERVEEEEVDVGRRERERDVDEAR